MSTNQTEHYGLHLWAPEDAFLRTEFNENTEKTDAAIKQNQDALEPIGRNLYEMYLEDYYGGKETGFRHGLLFDGFQDASLIKSMTGGLRVEGSSLRLDGPGTVGVMTRRPVTLNHRWSQARLWLRNYTGDMKPFVNGKEMTLRRIHSATTHDGVFCLEREFFLEGPGGEDVTFTLQVESLGNPITRVHDYGLMLV